MEISKLEFRKVGINYKTEISTYGTTITLYWLPKQERVHYTVIITGDNTEDLHCAAITIDKLIEKIRENKDKFTSGEDVVIINVPADAPQEKTNPFRVVIRKLNDLAKIFQGK